MTQSLRAVVVHPEHPEGLTVKPVELAPASERLAVLARLVADRVLHPHIAIEAPWTEIGPIARRLLDRAFAGKAVLHVS